MHLVWVSNKVMSVIYHLAVIYITLLVNSSLSYIFMRRRLAHSPTECVILSGNIVQVPLSEDPYVRSMLSKNEPVTSKYFSACLLQMLVQKGQ